MVAVVVVAEGECLPERGWGLGAGGPAWNILSTIPWMGTRPLIPQPLHFWESRLANAP